MQFERRKDHRRNEKLEELLKEVNGLLGPVESQVLAGYERNKYPLVLVMGNPRSGTTLFMQWLASLGCFAYPTNLLSRFYGAPYVGAKIQLMLTKHDFNNELFDFNPAAPFTSRLGKTKGVLAPNEFWYFWRRFFPYGEIQYLDEEGLSGVDNMGFLREVAAMEAVFDMPFAMKGTMTNWNIPYMADILDKVLFIYIRRNPFYIIQSLLKARLDYYGDLRAWHSYKPPEYFFLQERNPYEQVAGQVYFTKVAVEKGLERVADDRKLVVDYEEFCRQPGKVFEQITERFQQQGHPADWSYAGAVSFAAARRVSMTETEVEQIVATYREFSGETLVS